MGVTRGRSWATTRGAGTTVLRTRAAFGSVVLVTSGIIVVVALVLFSIAFNLFL